MFVEIGGQAVAASLEADLLVVGGNESAVAAANLMTVAGIWPADADSMFFQPDKAIPAGEWSAFIDQCLGARSLISRRLMAMP